MRPHGQTNKVFVLHAGLSPHITVPRSETVCQSLDVDTNNYEVVQRQLTGLRVVLGQEVLDECRSKPVAHLLQSLAQFCLLYEAAAVSVNTLEQTLPLVDVGKQTGKLLQVEAVNVKEAAELSKHRRKAFQVRLKRPQRRRKT